MDVPQRLGKYEIRGTLGRGAMGVVYDGWDPIIARRVAIKSVGLPANPDDETAEEIARFRREAQAAGRLSHPNIVGVFDYGETNDVAYIVMEFVDGPTLKSLLDKQERFPLDRIGRIMGDLLAGLQFSHANGVVHRDIKPANVMLTSGGQAKIADFGIARIEMSSMTQAGTVLGTPAYMSPEQFRGEVADARTDVYSSGVLLYQLLTGERPFEGGLTAIMHKALNSEPPAPSELSSTAPRAFDPVVKRAMAKRPADRFNSAEEFAQAIRAALAAPAGEAPAPSEDATIMRAATPRPATAPTRPAAPPPASSAPAKSRAPLIAGGAAAAVVVIAGAAWFLTRPAPAPEPAPTPAATTPAPVQPPAPLQVQPAAPAEVQPTSPAQVQPPAPEVKPATPTPPPQVQPATPQPPAPQTTAPQTPTPQTITPQTTAPQPGPAAPATPSVTPAALQQQLAEALQASPCTLAQATLQEGGHVAVDGFADPASSEALHGRFAGLGATPSVDWRLHPVNPVFCSALAALRPASALAGVPGAPLGLTLAGNRTTLRDGDPILPRVTMPDFAGELRVDYLAHDGSLAHLYPTLAEPASKLSAQPSRRLAPGEQLSLGDPGPGRPQWQSGEPYGTDMIIAVAAATPLRLPVTQNGEEHGDAYLAALGRAIEQARAAGTRVSATLLLVDAVPKSK